MNATIGIYGLASQSGRAFFADILGRGYKVIGYNRPTDNGRAVVDAINTQKGIYLDRPENTNKEKSHFIPLEKSLVTNDINLFVEKTDIIVIALPSTYQVSSVCELKEAGIQSHHIPLILSPSRTIASPYIWDILGERYPIVCFSTCPYSCKAPSFGVSLIKRRKRTWNATLEGQFSIEQKNLIRELFPQAAISKIPALTSLNNIGSVFHCATYLLNYDEIRRREKNGEVFSFYMDGIANRPDVGVVLEQIDQVRLQIAHGIGLNTFGLKENPREDVWRKLTNGLRALEEEHEGEIEVLRDIRRLFSEYLNTSITSGQHWLDLTYGVERMEGESLSEAIRRTPTYQNNSVPQLRYVTEDIPTGLVPLEALAKQFCIDCTVITDIIDKYDAVFDANIRETGRNLKQFDKDYITQYLKGML